MPLDPAQLSPVFRMQPGLRRMDEAEHHLTPLPPDSALALEKLRVLQAGASRHAAPGFDAGPALRAIAQRAALDLPGGLDAATPLELSLVQDLAVLDADSGTIPWMCVCVPSHWAPEDKLGKDFRSLHAPVADNQQLIAAADGLVRLVTGGAGWERHVWTLTPCARFDQHPHRHARTPWPDTGKPATFAAGCWWRTERQTFFPVGQGTRQAVFTIQVDLQPLTYAVATPSQAMALHDALASMSPDVLAYKGLTGAREPLLHWLADRR